MMHTDEHVIVPFTLRSFLGIVLLILVLTAPLWWPRHRSVSAMKAANLSGEWVGTAVITASQTGIGARQLLHLPAVLYLRLDTYDSFLQKVQGYGQMFIAGEEHPRAIKIQTLGPPKPGGRIDGELSGDLYPTTTPSALRVTDAARVVQGTAGEGTLHLQTIADGATVGYVFTSSLHPGSQADFEAASKQLNAGKP